ncbi:MAG TPA: hypothetical protein DDZ80_32045 [Cyanobacteria bacterium UBA8803]|nr:hypothetical protein [Cyanobacteria bacterium UBA8803]
MRGDRILAKRAIAHYKIRQLKFSVPMSNSIQQQACQMLDILNMFYVVLIQLFLNKCQDFEL